MERLTHPGLDALAAAGDWNAYGRLLAEEGCGWWFRMDIPRIDHHLRRLLAHQSAGLSPRLRLLEGIVTPLPGAEKLPGILGTLGALHRVLLLTRDVEGAAVCAGLALAAVWDFGTDFTLARPWLDRVAAHVERPALPALARAHLVAFLALFRLFLDADISAARALLDRQGRAAAEADCPELSLYGASVRALTELFAGDAPRGEVLLEDARSFLDRASPSSHARVYYELVRGVLLNGTGQLEEALSVLEAAAELLPEAWMPVSMRVQLAGYRLMAAALLRDEAEVARFEQKVRDLAVADRNHLHASFLHFGLAVSHLRRERPYRALVHAQTGVATGEASHSPIPVLLNRVVEGQAFGALNEADESEAAFQRLEQEAGQLAFFRRAAAVERAHIALQRGHADRARILLEGVGLGAVVPGAVFSAFRSPGFNQTFRSRLAPEGDSWRCGGECRINVETLGKFAVTVDGRPLYDRRWGSGRSQRLLKILIALGGSKVAVDELAGELWPDADGAQAYANFKTALARLRAATSKGADGPQWVFLKHGRVSLSRALVGVDALHFRERVHQYRLRPEPRALPALLETYRGPFLPHDNHSGVLVRTRRELQSLFVQCVGYLVEASAEGSLATDLLSHLTRAVELAPDAELLHARRVRCLLDAGYRVEALRAFRHAEAHFRDAFGVGPGEELNRLGALAREG